MHNLYTSKTTYALFLLWFMKIISYTEAQSSRQHLVQNPG